MKGKTESSPVCRYRFKIIPPTTYSVVASSLNSSSVGSMVTVHPSTVAGYTHTDGPSVWTATEGLF